MDWSWLAERFSFRTLLDIGANDGAFGAFLQERFAIPRVHAFEPLSGRATMLNDRGFTVHQMALSDYEGEADLVVSESDVGSSLLAPTAYCVGEYPQIRTIGTEKVRVRRLDDVLGALDGDVMIKMDAQGAEDAIIRGGARVFGAAQVVLTEVSFVPLYERSALFNDVHVELTALGFLLRGFRGQHAAAKSGEPLFAHCVYVR